MKQVQTGVKNAKKKAPDFTQTEKRKSWEMWGHVSVETDRANAALLSQVDSGMLETDPKHAREEPCESVLVR